MYELYVILYKYRLFKKSEIIWGVIHLLVFDEIIMKIKINYFRASCIVHEIFYICHHRLQKKIAGSESTFYLHMRVSRLR